MLDQVSFVPGDDVSRHQTYVSNLLLEQSVLGAILSRNELLESCGNLRAEHFFELFHRRLFEIITEMIRAGRKADLITLRSVLPPDIIAPGGLTIPQYIARLAAQTLSERP